MASDRQTLLAQGESCLSLVLSLSFKAISHNRCRYHHPPPTKLHTSGMQFADPTEAHFPLCPAAVHRESKALRCWPAIDPTWLAAGGRHKATTTRNVVPVFFLNTHQLNDTRFRNETCNIFTLLSTQRRCRSAAAVVSSLAQDEDTLNKTVGQMSQFTSSHNVMVIGRPKCHRCDRKGPLADSTSSDLRRALKQSSMLTPLLNFILCKTLYSTLLPPLKLFPYWTLMENTSVDKPQCLSDFFFVCLFRVVAV